MAINSRIHILKYNTYFDRIYKKENTIEEYDQYLLYDKLNNPGIFTVDFKPADGVNTSQIINWTGDEPNYLIVLDLNTNEIVSRWFVMEFTRIRGGQYQMSLKRDVVADNFDDIANSTAYINKAILPDSNVLIYNQEPITTNQIKTKEIPLMDDTKSAWIVGYIASNYDYTSGSGDYKNKMTVKGQSIYYDYSATSLSGWNLYQYTTNYYYYNNNGYHLLTQVNKNSIQIMYDNDTQADYVSKISSTSVLYRIRSDSTFNKWISDNIISIRDVLDNYVSLYNPHPQPTSSDIRTQIFRSNGKILRVGTSESNYKYYRINTIDERWVEERVNVTTDKSGQYVYTYLNNKFATFPYKDISSAGNPAFALSFLNDRIKIKLTEVSTAEYNLNFPFSEPDASNTNKPYRNKLKDAPYDMFAIPYADDFKLQILLDEYTFQKEVSLQVAIGIVSTLGDSCYDLQLLPYCPFTGYEMENGKMILKEYGTKRITEVKTSGGDMATVLIWCTASSGTKNIILDEPITFDNKKIENQVNNYRLVSPNFSGQFDFNLARNNTPSLQVFNVDYTYIPYNPYIHINPVFSGLYGEDFNDIRGLICGGDFSLAKVNDAWTNYQLQNKNYQAIFNRETQNLEVNHKYDFQQGVMTAILGSFQGSASGMQAGSSAGPIGAAVGAAVGGTVSLAAGIGDVAYGEAKYTENMKYRKDVFNMQLDNIKALPYSISKTTAYTYNNKIFPILEFYTCTPEEKLAFANLIANSSMTVQAIGTLSNYIYNTWSYGDIKSRGYLSCQIIKLGNLSADAHMQYAIADEMEKGLYFGG